MKHIILLLLLLISNAYAQYPFALLQAHDDSVRNAKKNPVIEAHHEVDTTTYESDNVHTHVTVTVNSDVIDSLQSIYDINYRALYTDKMYAKSKNFLHSDKIRYMRYLITNKLRDTSSVVDHAKKLLLTYGILLQINSVLISTADVNDRYIIKAHIRKNRIDMQHLTSYIVSLITDNNYNISHKNEVE